jgi:hypothetical protein
MYFNNFQQLAAYQSNDTHLVFNAVDTGVRDIAYELRRLLVELQHIDLAPANEFLTTQKMRQDAESNIKFYSRKFSQAFEQIAENDKEETQRAVYHILKPVTGFQTESDFISFLKKSLQ